LGDGVWTALSAANDRQLSGLRPNETELGRNETELGSDKTNRWLQLFSFDFQDVSIVKMRVHFVVAGKRITKVATHFECARVSRRFRGSAFQWSLGGQLALPAAATFEGQHTNTVFYLVDGEQCPSAQQIFPESEYAYNVVTDHVWTWNLYTDLNDAGRGSERQRQQDAEV
jgi:hypothetical protein